MNYKMPYSLKFSFYLLITLVAVLSCDCSSNSQNKTSYDKRSPQEIEEQRIEARRDFLKKERAAIEEYIETRDLDLQRTGTGMYYQITRDSTSVNGLAETEDIVEYAYNISALDGTLLYSSAANGTATLRIDKEDAEIGLHEAFKLMGLGDEGLFILPSHLAFGVGGNSDKVPPMTPLVYELKIVNIQKSKS